eukprot:TRINITY_DN93898_c0_g1_i1.p1 TRINITY_DN93898_c0_g1~~TRINITY_DN93898_c0_g1_i1.p1  ORF type:complete len:172 (-),score=29.37 TRINITY_DN93898_c0_g1_i1:45-560(-)
MSAMVQDTAGVRPILPMATTRKLTADCPTFLRRLRPVLLEPEPGVEHPEDALHFRRVWRLEPLAVPREENSSWCENSRKNSFLVPHPPNGSRQSSDRCPAGLSQRRCLRSAAGSARAGKGLALHKGLMLLLEPEPPDSAPPERPRPRRSGQNREASLPPHDEEDGECDELQ